MSAMLRGRPVSRRRAWHTPPQAGVMRHAAYRAATRPRQGRQHNRHYVHCDRDNNATRPGRYSVHLPRKRPRPPCAHAQHETRSGRAAIAILLCRNRIEHRQRSAPGSADPMPLRYAVGHSPDQLPSPGIDRQRPALGSCWPGLRENGPPVPVMPYTRRPAARRSIGVSAPCQRRQAPPRGLMSSIRNGGLLPQLDTAHRPGATAAAACAARDRPFRRTLTARPLRDRRGQRTGPAARRAIRILPHPSRP